MGFYITGDLEENGYIYEKANELKQHINLSNYAWQIVMDDIRNFYADESKESFSGFLNTVFINFFQEANATISQRYINKNDELVELFSSEEFKTYDPNTTNLYISKMLDVHEKNLLEIANSYLKGTGKKYRINKENLDILRDSTESIYYDDSIGKYLKAIFEEYALKPIQERERIFFKATINAIERAIVNQNKLKISILQKMSVTNEKYYTRKFYVTAYKVFHDKSMSFNYLIGFAEEINDSGQFSTKHVSSFRINRIDKINVMSSMSGFISKQNKAEIEQSIIEKGPQFMAGDLINIEILFTKKGIESYNRQIYMRPQYYFKKDDIYHFNCTEVQAMNYFFKFGREIRVIEPLYLKEKFIKRYQDALNHYKKMDKLL